MRVYIAGAAAICLVCAAGPTRADDAAVQRQIESKYAVYAQAMKARDADRIMALSTSRFTMHVPGQPVRNRRQAAAEMKRMFRVSGPVKKADVRVQSVKVNGNRAVATVKMSYAGSIRDKKGKYHSVSDNSSARDIWVKTPRGWLVQKVDILSDRMMMDGKPVPGGPHTRRSGTKARNR